MLGAHARAKEPPLLDEWARAPPHLLGSIQEVELPVLLPQEVLGMERRLPLQVHTHHTVPCRGVTSVPPPPPGAGNNCVFKGSGSRDRIQIF